MSVNVRVSAERERFRLGYLAVACSGAVLPGETAEPSGFLMCRMGWLSQDDQSNGMPMKRFLLLALMLTEGNAYAQVDPKVAEQCEDARDFLGCVKAQPTQMWQ